MELIFMQILFPVFLSCLELGFAKDLIKGLNGWPVILQSGHLSILFASLVNPHLQTKARHSNYCQSKP
jgi:hypothetical protein